MKNLKMKKLSLISLAVSALAFFFAALAVTPVRAEEAVVAANIRASITLAKDITVNFYAEGLTCDTATMTFKMGDDESFEPVTQTVSDGNAVFSFDGISPEYMSRKITACVYAGEDMSVDPVATKETTVAEYLENLLKTVSPEMGVENVALRNLAIATLKFGATAQEYCGNTEEGLPVEKIKQYQALYVDDLAAGLEGTDKEVNNTSDLSWTKAGLYFKNTVTLYFDFLTKADNLTAKIDGEAVDVTAQTVTVGGNGYDGYRITYPISVIDVDTVFTAQVYSDGVALGNPIKYSVKSFFAAAKDKSDSLYEFVKAFYNYGAYANKYVAVKESAEYKPTTNPSGFKNVADDSDMYYSADGVDYGTFVYDNFGHWLYREEDGMLTWAQNAADVLIANGMNSTSSNLQSSDKTGRNLYYYTGGDITATGSYAAVAQSDSTTETAYAKWAAAPSVSSYPYAFNFNAPKSGTVSIILSLSRQNTNSSATSIDKNFAIYKGSVSDENKITTSAGNLFNTPSISKGYIFFEYVVANVPIKAGDNTFTVKYTKGSGNTYFQYFRVEYVSYEDGFKNPFDNSDMYYSDGETDYGTFVYDNFGKWLYREEDGALTWAQNAADVRGGSSNNSNNDNQNIYCYNGKGDKTDSNSYTLLGNKADDSNNAVNKAYAKWSACYYVGSTDYTFTFTAPRDGNMNIILSLSRMENFGTDGSYLLSNQFALYKDDDTTNLINDSKMIYTPNIRTFLEYVVANVEVEAGENKFIVRYKKSASNQKIYFQYLRVEYTSFGDGTCSCGDGNHSYKTIPEYGTDYTAAEATLGEWQVCEICHEVSWTQYATAGNSISTKDDKTIDSKVTEYVLKSGVAADTTSTDDYTGAGRYINYSATTRHFFDSKLQDEKPEIYTFKVNAETDMTVDIIIRARNMTRASSSATDGTVAYDLENTLTVTVNDEVKTLADEAVLKATADAQVFYEYTVCKEVTLKRGENTIVLTFEPDKNDEITGNYPYRGCYWQYIRLVQQ